MTRKKRAPLVLSLRSSLSPSVAPSYPPCVSPFVILFVTINPPQLAFAQLPSSTPQPQCAGSLNHRVARAAVPPGRLAVAADWHKR